jgi:hypothetical protein
MRLQLLDPSGVVVSTLDGSTSDSSGNWSLKGQLPKHTTPGSSIRVKAKKRSVGKFVCQAGVSTTVPTP